MFSLVSLGGLVLQTTLVSAREDESMQPLEGKTILIVDDSLTIRATADSLLSGLGARTELAEDGYDALAQIQHCRPDMVLMDVMMPRLDGYQTCALIRSSPEFNTLPVVMLSSKDSLQDKVRGKVAGSNEYLVKPIDPALLIEAVLRHTR